MTAPESGRPARIDAAFGEIDGVTLLPNVAYRLNALGEFTAVDS